MLMCTLSSVVHFRETRSRFISDKLLGSISHGTIHSRCFIYMNLFFIILSFFQGSKKSRIPRLILVWFDYRFYPSFFCGSASNKNFKKYMKLILNSK